MFADCYLSAHRSQTECISHKISRFRDSERPGETTETIWLGGQAVPIASAIETAATTVTDTDTNRVLSNWANAKTPHF